MRACLILVLLFAVWCLADAQPSKTLPVPRKSPVAAIYDRTRSAVVLVSVSRESGKPAVCAGVVVGKGHIVTAQHMIGSSQEVQVHTVDNEAMSARVVRHDEDSGLTLLSVTGGPEPIPLAPDGALDVGDSVISVGHNYGFYWTCTAGIVSGLGREIAPSGWTITGVIQTDAAINTGSSGGPLINMDGELVGITLAYHGVAQNIGFVVPVAAVRRLLREQ